MGGIVVLMYFVIGQKNRALRKQAEYMIKRKKEENQHRMRDKIKTMTARKTKLFTILKNFTTEIEEELKAQWKDFEEFLQYINIRH